MPRGPCLALALILAVVVPSLALAQEEPVPEPAPGLEEPPPSPPPGTPPPGVVTPPPATPAPPGAVAVAVPTPRPVIQLPPSLAFLPAESGRLDSHVDLQFFWSHIDIPYSTRSFTAEGIMLGLEGQVAFADLFELGLTVPFLLQSWASFLGQSESNSQFGNLMLDLKVKVAGSSNGPFALSLFANWILPTMTGVKNRDYAGLQGGVAVSGALSLLTLGGAFGTLWAINGNGKDALLLLFDLHLAARFHRVIAGYLMLQLGAPVYPDTGSPAVAIAPGVQVYPLPAPIDGLHLDLGVRIATNDEAKLFYSAGSRAQLTFAMGYAF